MSVPKDKTLYNKIKKKVYEDMPTHSAYRSGHLVRQYKDAYEKKHNNKDAYEGKKKEKTPLKKWFMEKWRNQRGEVGYSKKGDIYRPTIRVNKKTPTTIKELTSKQIKNAMLEKKKTGRVSKFKK